MLARCMISAAIGFATGCSFASDPGPADDDNPVAGRGEVIDFQSGTAVTAITDITISGLIPLPHVTLDGGSFAIEGVPENSVFGVLAVVPMHRSTYSQVVVTNGGIDGI